MLRTVKHYIDELPDIPFSQFFLLYIMDVQDVNIDIEADMLFRNKDLDVSTICNVNTVINDVYEGLVKQHD